MGRPGWLSSRINFLLSISRSLWCRKQMRWSLWLGSRYWLIAAYLHCLELCLACNKCHRVMWRCSVDIVRCPINNATCHPNRLMKDSTKTFNNSFSLNLIRANPTVSSLNSRSGSFKISMTQTTSQCTWCQPCTHTPRNSLLLKNYALSDTTTVSRPHNCNTSMRTPRRHPSTLLCSCTCEMVTS